MDSISLSYVLTSYNKLHYLQLTLPLLMGACQPDEEIIVIDGGSTDGSREYLSKLHQQGAIHQYRSESDHGEAHGTNKAIIMARGTLIKIVTDDDVFSFGRIRKVKDWMLNHPEIDLVAANGGYLNAMADGRFTVLANHQDMAFKEWLKSHKPFLFSGLSIMLRRHSIPLLGLFDSAYLIIDYEYSLRVTSGPAKLAWYMGSLFVNIINPSSNSTRKWQRLYREKSRLLKLYGLDHELVRSRYVAFRTAISLSLRRLLRIQPKSSLHFQYHEVFSLAIEYLQAETDEDSTFVY